ncbi:hypothetical protein ACFYZJ_18025 [Streptomyces sp. NPDC001848]|uniref:hypothetical protein n=1 Tax=Streptomyces sp. NPDC001848 TaxID=3364618 RepID=UPI003698A8D1
MDVVSRFSSDVSNARQYAPGPVLLDLRVTGAVIEVVVWDSDPVLPVAPGPPTRAAQASTDWRP